MLPSVTRYGCASFRASLEPPTISIPAPLDRRCPASSYASRPGFGPSGASASPTPRPSRARRTTIAPRCGGRAPPAIDRTQPSADTRDARLAIPDHVVDKMPAATQTVRDGSALRLALPLPFIASLLALSFSDRIATVPSARDELLRRLRPARGLVRVPARAHTQRARLVRLRDPGHPRALGADARAFDDLRRLGVVLAVHLRPDSADRRPDRVRVRVRHPAVVVARRAPPAWLRAGPDHPEHQSVPDVQGRVVLPAVRADRAWDARQGIHPLAEGRPFQPHLQSVGVHAVRVLDCSDRHRKHGPHLGQRDRCESRDPAVHLLHTLRARPGRASAVSGDARHAGCGFRAIRARNALHGGDRNLLVPRRRHSDRGVPRLAPARDRPRHVAAHGSRPLPLRHRLRRRRVRDVRRAGAARRAELLRQAAVRATAEPRGPSDRSRREPRDVDDGARPRAAAGARRVGSELRVHGPVDRAVRLDGGHALRRRRISGPIAGILEAGVQRGPAQRLPQPRADLRRRLQPRPHARMHGGGAGTGCRGRSQRRWRHTRAGADARTRLRSRQDRGLRSSRARAGSTAARRARIVVRRRGRRQLLHPRLERALRPWRRHRIERRRSTTSPGRASAGQPTAAA